MEVMINIYMIFYVYVPLWLVGRGQTLFLFHGNETKQVT